jgi:hypothetical protein
MKQLLIHLIKENLADIANRSYLNYGVRGLHMVNILDTPTQGIKLFMTDTNNDTQSSNPIGYTNGIKLPFKHVGRNICVECLQGYVGVWSVEEEINNIALLCNKFTKKDDEYKLDSSHIGLRTKQMTHLQPGQFLNIPATEIVNFSSRFGNQSVWLVYEGRGVENLPDVYYTNLDNYNNTQEANTNPNLYMRTSSRDVVNMLDMIGLLK